MSEKEESPVQKFPHVLIVDDDKGVSRSLAAFLEDRDFEVKTAENAEIALHLMKDFRFHAAVIDLRLPGMSGDMIILKAHVLFPHIRFLVYTGSSAFQLSEELQQIGMTSEHVFIKPLSDLSIIADTLFNLADHYESI